MRNNKGDFSKGHIPWNKGLKGLHLSPGTEFKKGGISLRKGVVLSEETKKKISMTLTGTTEWDGFARTRDYKERRRFQEIMQKQIFERDNYTCQLCGIRGADMQVDHIQSWAEYVELRFNMDNCRTLCAKCHYKITFGKEMPKTVKGWGHNLLRGVKP